MLRVKHMFTYTHYGNDMLYGYTGKDKDIDFFVRTPDNLFIINNTMNILLGSFYIQFHSQRPTYMCVACVSYKIIYLCSILSHLT